MKITLFFLAFILFISHVFSQRTRGIEYQLIPIDTAQRIYKFIETRYMICPYTPSSLNSGSNVVVKSIDGNKPFYYNYFNGGLPIGPYYDSTILNHANITPRYFI